MLLLPASEAQEQELLENQAKWEVLEWDTYRFNIQQISNVAPPSSGKLLVQVYQNQVKSIFWEGQDVTDEVTRAAPVPTLSELFDRLQLNLDQVPYYYNVTYDAAYGYPANVDINPVKEICDEELDITVSNVVRSKCRENKRRGLICKVL